MPETNVLPMPTPIPGTVDERTQAEALARRYHAEFVDLKNFKIQHELLRTVPVELMFRYNFVPIELTADALVIDLRGVVHRHGLPEADREFPDQVTDRSFADVIGLAAMFRNDGVCGTGQYDRGLQVLFL